MKRLLFTILTMIIFNSESHAQFINSLSIYPTNPTSNDSIYLIGSCYFQSGTCNQKTLNYSIINETIDCDALHCIGMLTYICYDTDTFSVGKLPAGNYTYRYFVNAGFGNNPCTPGIVPGPSDSLNFTVTTASGISTPSMQEIAIGPNPCTDFIDVTFFNNEEKHLSIIDLTGKICHQEIKTGNRIHIATQDFSPGLYILRAKTKSTNYQSKLFYKK